MRRLLLLAAAAAALSAAGPAAAHPQHGGLQLGAPSAAKEPRVAPAGRRWLAGDHHVHSHYSADYKAGAGGKSPPEPVIGGDSRNTIPTNARMALKHGLDWMVATDHGGPNHSAISRDQAYPELLRSRREVAGLLQFFGMELNTPAAEHSSIIVPRTPAERDVLFGIESRFDRAEAWPFDPARNKVDHMLAALRHMRAIEVPPVVIANHPSRTAPAVGQYGLVSPA
jgi:hypothetical protein